MGNTLDIKAETLIYNPKDYKSQTVLNGAQDVATMQC